MKRLPGPAKLATKAGRSGGGDLCTWRRLKFRKAVVGAICEEINVIGCTVEEAVGRVDKFLDNAALSGAVQARIIHGHGTGALRRWTGRVFEGASVGG